jgi:hypothetical protein
MTETCPLCGGDSENTESHRRLEHTQRAQQLIDVNGVQYKVGYNINKNPVLYNAAQPVPQGVYVDISKIPEAPTVTTQGSQGKSGGPA